MVILYIIFGNINLVIIALDPGEASGLSRSAPSGFLTQGYG